MASPGIPAGLSALAGAPPLCAGLTTFKAIEQLTLRPGSLVAVQGIGGLGRLGLQYAGKFGYRVAATVRWTGKAPLAKQFDADRGVRPITVNTLDLVFGNRSLTGTPIENEDNLSFRV